MPTGDPRAPTDDPNAETVESQPGVARRRAWTYATAPAGADPQVWNALQNCLALTRLPPIALRDLWAAATERSFQQGDALMSQGDAAEGLPIILDGTAHAMLRNPTAEA